MKPSFIIAATLALAGLAPGLATPASAQHTVVRERTVVHAGPPRHEHVRRVCHWEVHRHHRTQVCRTGR